MNLSACQPRRGVGRSTSGGTGDSGGSQVKEAARAVDQKIEVVEASNAKEIDQAFSAIAQMQADALIVVSSPFFTNSRYQIVTLANHNRIPAIYPLVSTCWRVVW